MTHYKERGVLQYLLERLPLSLILEACNVNGMSPEERSEFLRYFSQIDRKIETKRQKT